MAGSVAVLCTFGMTLLIGAQQARADDTDRITDLFGPPPINGAVPDAALFDQYASERLHDDIAPWVNSPFRPVVDVPSGQYVIGDGGDAGLWFDDGSNGLPGPDSQSNGTSGAGTQNNTNNP
ncbi:hypothetical protein [[Mycobacterium] nativiensis]|uniref:Uncharacterized protein n=1 Tax=[Mycobacterium] nativiensis TaxID=2855503 RepID=A0ABU5Y290_9MYCO|nr:hypothetical protein [Mycolicibacter sp. MYC340]MEB3033846.1 hypothetical protein [Mycolicibacter sp. MYC340]